MHLDGQAVELTNQERRLAEQIASGGAVVTAGIDARLRRQAIDRAKRSMTARLAKNRRRKAILACFTTAESIAVAAVLVIAITLQTMAPLLHMNIWNNVPLEAFGPDQSGEIAQQISLVQQDIDLLEAELLVSPETMDPAEIEIDELQYQLDELLQFDSSDLLLEG